MCKYMQRTQTKRRAIKIRTDAQSLRNVVGMMDDMKIDDQNFNILYNENLVGKKKSIMKLK